MKRGNRFINETNKRYGRLTVIDIDQELSNSRGRMYWVCKCDCGNISSKCGESLRMGNVKSCGCLAYELKRETTKKKPYEHVYNHLISSAKKCNRKCDITYDDLLKFTTKTTCHYCGTEIKWQSHTTTIGGIKNRTRNYNLDRVDNSIDYTNDNCVVCCAICNFMKKSMNKEKFLSHVTKIYNFQESQSQSHLIKTNPQNCSGG